MQRMTSKKACCPTTLKSQFPLPPNLHVCIWRQTTACVACKSVLSARLAPFTGPTYIPIFYSLPSDNVYYSTYFVFFFSCFFSVGGFLLFFFSSPSCVFLRDLLQRRISTDIIITARYFINVNKMSVIINFWLLQHTRVMQQSTCSNIF